MQLRALTCVVGPWLVVCAVGTEPTLRADPPTSGGQSGAEATEGSGGVAGAGAAAGTEAGGAAGTATVAGSAGVGGAGGSGGTGGGGGAGGATAGAGGNGGVSGGGAGGGGGSGGMPAQVEPQSITVSTTRNATAKQSPSAGGTAYTDDCPANQVLIGFRGTTDGGIASLRSVQGICGTLSVGANSPYAVTTAQAGMLTARETAGNTVENAMCPANQVIIGFSGRAAQYIEALVFRCAPLTISGNAPNYQLNIDNATNTSPIGGENAGTAFNAINCQNGQVAVTQMPNAGSAIDNFGLKCSALSLVVN